MNIPFDTGVSAPSPTTPPPSGDPNAVIAAFAKAVMSRESGGRTNAISPQGATGSMQIMPDTFRQYAAPGEVYENDSHRTNAALRKIVDDYQFYKGDLAKVAAAYIGGRGAVRPDGTIRTDVRDALGTTPAAYSQQVLARMGAVPSAAQPTAPATPAAERGPDIGVNAAGDTLYVNGQLFKVDDRGRALQLLRDGTMTRSGEGKLPPGFSQPPAGSVEAYLTRIVPSSATGKAFTAGVENWKGGYNEIFGAGQQIFGVDPANNTGMQRADVNKRYASELAALNPLPQKFDDAQGVVGVGQYTYGKLLESMPYLAEMLGGGLVGKLVQVGVRAGAPVAVQAAGRAAYEAAMAKGMGEAAAQAAAKKGMQEFGSAIPMIAGVAASYPSAVGDVLGNQREESGGYDAASAAALGVPYAALNAIGGGAAAVNLLTRGTVRGAGLAAAVPGVAGRAARGAVAAGITGVEEAAGEYGQEWLNQAGRRAVNPAYDFGSPEAVAARRESAIAGGLVGAAVGGAGGAATRAQAAQPRDLINPPAEPAATPAVPGEPLPPNAGPTGDARLFAPVPPASLDAAPLVPTGNLDYRAEPSPFTGVRAPLVTPDQAAAMQQTTGVAQPPVSSFVPAEPLRGGIDPTGAVSPQEVMIQQDAGAAQVPVATPSATGAQVQGGGTWDAADLSNAVRVPMPETKRTTSVVRQRPARVKRTTGETEGSRVDTGPVTGSTEQGQVVTATLPENETGGITPASPVNLRRGERGSTTILDTGTSQRGEVRARGEAAAPAAQAAPKAETKAEAPTDEQVSELEAEVSRILAAKKSEGAPLPTKRKPPKEPTRGEEVKARQLGKKIHEAFENSPDMPEVVTAAHRAGTIAQRLGGASMFASLSKIGQAAKDAGGWFAVPLTKGAAGRVANDTVERASAIERVFQQFDHWVEKHGVAGVNEFFKYRKANNLEMTADEAVSYAEGEEEVGDVKGKERYANAVLSNLWRLYRSGKFNDNPFGLTSDTRGEIRGRKETDGTAKRLMGWFDGTQQPPWKGGWGTLKGENTGMVRLATYFRFHGRSNLTNLLGSALARVFRASRVDVDFKMVSGSAVTVDGTTYGGLYLHASKAKPITVETQDGKVTISKPTILMPTESVNEELVLHEMLHAATVNGITPSARAGMKRIIDALRESKPKDGRAHRAWNAITGTKDEFEAVMELISYGFTDNAFQQYMKDVKMPARKSVASKLGTVFEYFVNMVKLALGVHNARTSALGQFIEEGFGTLRAAEQSGKKTSRGFLGSRKFDFRTGNQVVHKGMKKTGVVTAVKPTPLSYDLIDFKDSEGNVHTVKDYELEYHWRGPRQGSLFGAVKGDDWIKDESGHPLKLYRGVFSNDTIPHDALQGKPRSGYAVFASTSPHVASSYANIEPQSKLNQAGAVVPMFVRASKVEEFPTKDGNFDMFAFDRRAKALPAGTVLVARGVYDMGPRASKEVDPEKLYSYPSDVFAWGEGTETAPAYGGYFGSLPAQAESVVPVSELKAPTRIVEQVYKTLIQTSLPFMYREGADGKTAFENFVDKGKSSLLSYVKDNHPDVALHLQGFAGDLFMPAPYKASLDVMRHVGHQAAMDIDKMYTAIGKLDRAQEEKLHAYMMSKGELDGFSDEQKKVAAEFRMAVNRFMADAREAGVLPEWTKDVSIGDIIQWVEKDSVRIPSGVKASNAFKLAKYHRQTIKDGGIVQGDNKAGYHALYDAETIVGFVPVGTTEADARTQLDLDANAVLETGKLWRMESSKDGKTTMIHTPTFAEKRDAMKAASYMDALALTVHTLAHDTGVTQVANSLASDENMNTKGGLAYSDVELLKEHEGEHAVVEDSNVNKTQQRLARTPGYWTKLGSGYGKLSGTYVPGPVYAALTDYASTQSIFGPTYGRILQLWKENKTSLSPGTHISNVMSSFVMAYMHDIPASTIMHAFEIARGKDGNEHAMAVWKEFEKSGALLSSYRSSELANTVVQKLEQEVARRAGVQDSASGLVKLLEAWERSKAAALVKGGREAAAHLYEMEDNVFRLAAYMEFVRRETGKPSGMRGEELIRAGGKFAADAMINYSINAKYINKLRSSVLPFLAWPYRAIPMLANMALFQPWKLATVVTYVYALNALAYAIDGGDEDEERKRLPEWNKGNVWGMPGIPKMLRMPFSADGKPVFVNLSAYMPLGNINTDTASGLPSTLLPGGPVWTAVEILLGHNSFTGQPINRPAQSAGEKTANVLDFAWEAWAPGIPLPFNREGDKLADLWRGKHGVGGEPAEPITSVLSALGPKIVAVDLHEQEVRTALATRAMAREFQTEVRRVAREEYRYESPDVEKVREKQAALVERFHEKLLKLKGEK